MIESRGEGCPDLPVKSKDRYYRTRYATEDGMITKFFPGCYGAIQYIEGCE